MFFFLRSAIAIVYYFPSVFPTSFRRSSVFLPKTFASITRVRRQSPVTFGFDIPTAVRDRPGGVSNRPGNVRSTVNVIPPPPPSPVAAAAAAGTCGGYTCGGIGGRRRRAHHPHHHQQHHHRTTAGGLSVPHVAGDADRRPDRRGPSSSAATHAGGTEKTATAAATTMASSSTGGSKWAWRPRRPRWTAGVHGPQPATLLLAAVTLAMLSATAVQVTVICYFQFNRLSRAP